MPNVDKPRVSRRNDSQPNTKADRPHRVPLGRYRDILNVEGKDPAFYYRWVKDNDTNGSRILEFRRAGYELVPADEVIVGEDKVDKSSEHAGGVVRLNFRGETLYLMKQPLEFRKEDTGLYHAEVDELERHITNPDTRDTYSNLYGPAQYGEVKIDRG